MYDGDLNYIFEDAKKLNGKFDNFYEYEGDESDLLLKFSDKQDYTKQVSTY